MRDLQNRTLFLIALTVLAVVARLIPHPPNFSPLGALALFGGASFADRRMAFLLPLAVMLLSDLFLGIHSLLPVVYGCLMLNVLLGRWAGNKLNVSRLVPAALLGSVIFFVITNLGVWLTYHEPTWQGLVECFALAIPFFQNTLASDLFYGSLLFGSLALAQSWFPALKPGAQRSPDTAAA